MRERLYLIILITIVLISRTIILILRVLILISRTIIILIIGIPRIVLERILLI